jgi:FKBP-type peptidyl-prolyl cis-trans isomerase
MATADVDEEARVNRILKVREIMLERDEARTNNNFTLSDTFREKLKNMGVEVIDQKGGPSGWKFIDGTSKKLKAGSNIVMPSKKRTLDESTTEETTSVTKKVDKKQKVVNSSDVKKDANNSSDVKKDTKKAVPKSLEQERNKAALGQVLGVTSGVKNIQGVLIEDITLGAGKKAESGKKVKVFYSGKLKTTGKVFDASLTKPFVFHLGRSEVIKGWDIGVAGMLVGGKRRITCPPEKAYGRVGAPPTIPSNSTLIFDVTLIDVI